MRSAAILILPACAALSIAQVKIPEGTKVRVRLEQTLSSATAEQGQPVQLSVTDDVKVDGVVVIAQGATVTGTIVQAVPKRRLGRTGKLDFSIDRVVAADGDSVPLRYSIAKKEGGSHGVQTGILTAGAAVVFWPAAPVFLLMKGKDVTLNRGMAFEVFTDQNHTVQPRTVVALPPAAPASAAPQSIQPSATASSGEPAVVAISSEAPGAEIEVDGSFVGSTPTTLRLPAGTHRLTVRNGADTWQRELTVHAASSISVHASLPRR